LWTVLALGSATAGPPGWTETFARGGLEPARWQVIADGDFRERAVDVVTARGGSPGFRLRIRADTRGTADDTVKVLGVRSVQPIALEGRTRVAVTLDWNDQANGSYLTAGLVLSPHVTAGSPLATPDWLRIEYVGIPPGRNARMVVAVQARGQRRTLYTEGWPDANRAGRPIGRQKVEVVVSARAFEVRENGRRVYGSPASTLSFDAAHLYVQMSSHSNFPAREVYVDGIEVGPDRP
jgi:hypothetical protein